MGSKKYNEYEIWERIEDIYDYIGYILEEAKKNDGIKEDIKSITVGDRARVGNADPPGVWVIMDESPVEQVNAMSENWRINIVVAGMSLGNKPLENRKKADRIAAQAASVILQDRTLNGLIIDIVRTGYSPAMPRIETSKQMYGAGHSLQLRFTHREGV